MSSNRAYPTITFVSLLLLPVMILLSGCGAAHDNAADTQQAGPASGKPTIVAAENFYGEAAKAVGGDYVDVTSVLNGPNADPHDYEPTPDASKAVDRASVVLYNGIGYDEWMKKLVDASGDAAKKTVIAVGSDIMGKKAGDNAHVWYIPETMPKLADALAQRLGELDPAHKEAFLQQAEAYKQSLQPMAELVGELSKHDAAVPIAVSEPVFDYMAEALKFMIADKKFSLAAEQETDPAPADIGALQDAIKSKQIKLFIENSQASSPTVDNMIELARHNQVPVVDVTETMPEGKTYGQWMMDQLNQVKTALQR